MKKGGFLSAPVAEIIATMGHTMVDPFVKTLGRGTLR